MSDWRDYSDVYPGPGHTITGQLRVLQDCHSPQLDNTRDLIVHLPPSYATDEERRYPVLYMHDGQNLFDAATSFIGEWGVDETMEALGRAGDVEAIVVGVPNSGAGRIDEYSPFADPDYGGGKADLYLEFLIDTVRPAVDAEFRTLTEREHTGILGSSMGGLVSLYAFFHRPEAFGFAGVMSPSVGFADGLIFDRIAAVDPPSGRLYLDVGTQEVKSHRGDPMLLEGRSSRYTRSVRRLRKLLASRGYGPRELLYVEEKGAVHHESAWGRRLPDAVRFLVTGRRPRRAATPASRPSPLLRFGFFQFAPEPAAVERNLERIAEAMSEIDADLVVLPELCTTGYQFSSRAELAELAEPIPGPTTRVLGQLAREHQCYLVAGIAEQSDGRLYNSAAVVGPDGLVGSYRKLHLFGDEKRWFTPGDRPLEVFDVGGVPVGVLICFDHHFPEATRTLALRGARILCHPSNLTDPSNAQLSSRVRSMENRIFWILANRYGSEHVAGKTMEFTGRSQIVAPDGKVIARGPADRDNVRIVELDVSRAADKHVSPLNDLFSDRRTDMYDLGAPSVEPVGG